MAQGKGSIHHAEWLTPRATFWPPSESSSFSRIMGCLLWSSVRWRSRHMKGSRTDS